MPEGNPSRWLTDLIAVRSPHEPDPKKHRG